MKPEIVRTKDLKLKEVPLATASLEAINAFALTFDVDEQKNKLAGRTLNEGLDHLPISDLRAMLYVEQRRWNHFGRNYDADTEKSIRRIIEVIREKLFGA